MDELLEMEEILNKLSEEKKKNKLFTANAENKPLKEEKKNKLFTANAENKPLKEEKENKISENPKEKDNAYFNIEDFEAVTKTRTGSGIKAIIDGTKKEIFNKEKQEKKQER